MNEQKHTGSSTATGGFQHPSVARTVRPSENQHYVPKLLLRGFAFRKKKEWYVHTFDKHAERVFSTNIRNIAAERGFYDFTLRGRTFRYEQALSSLEHNTSAAFNKLLNAARVSALSDEDMAWISVFIAAQHVRVKNFRESLLDMDRQLSALITASGGDPDTARGFHSFRNDDEIKHFVFRFLMENLPGLAGEMLRKQWVLLDAASSVPFWIGDNPVAMHNHREFGPYGNIGLAVPGIEVYLPIHKRLTLGLWCPTLLEQMKRDLKEAKSKIEQTRAYSVIATKLDAGWLNEQNAQLHAIVSKLDNDIKAIEDGRPLRCSADNVMYLNSLQARWADRYVMSPTCEFSLIRRMLKDFPTSRQGPRVRVG